MLGVTCKRCILGFGVLGLMTFLGDGVGVCVALCVVNGARVAALQHLGQYWSLLGSFQAVHWSLLGLLFQRCKLLQKPSCWVRRH